MMNVFKENDLKTIADGTLTKAMLSTASAEDQEKFEKKQIKIMRMIGMSVPPEVLQQIRDKETRSEMWAELCNLFEANQNEAIKAYTVRRLENELWDKKLAPGGVANLYLGKMFSIKSELVGLQHTIEDSTMVDMLLESLSELAEFECLKSSIRYGSDPSVYTQVRVRELILAAAARQKEFRTKRQGKQGGHKGGGGKGNDPDKGGNGNQQNKPNEQRKTRLCFVCGSDSHIKANCPEREEKKSGAVDNDSKRKPQGNLTLSQEKKSGAVDNDSKRKPQGNLTLSQEKKSGAVDNDSKRKPQGNLTLSQVDNVPSQILQQAADQGVVAGLMTAEAHLKHEIMYEVNDHGAGVDESLLEISDQEPAEDNFSGWWYFDTASNSHVVGDRSYFVSFTEDTSRLRSIRGIIPTIAARIAGVGTVEMTTEVNGEQTVMYLEDVFYIPGAEFGLFSPGLAHEQGFDFTFDHDTQDFTILWEGRAVALAKPQEATWGFLGVHPGQSRVKRPVDRRSLANFTVAEGVGTLALWHERMCHTCPQYLKTMVDKGLVKGMMLSQRHQEICDACHLGKQKKKGHRKKLDRATKWPNQVVYADLQIPSKDNRTRYEAVLVVMDGYSRFVKVYLLTSKEGPIVNKHLQKYILWAERQAGRDGDGAAYKVKRVLTDKGGEFINRGMENWYARRGIEHIRVGPKSSQLNLCERTHQSLMDMMKTTMLHAGLPRSLWPEALRNAVYVKNRVYNRGTHGVPYEMMFGMKPDVHHIRKFGSLAYVHVPVTSGRRKHDNNAKIGFVLGYEGSRQRGG
ncbi:Retrovirus-related Pol polyprotein from transposon TNT 1-94 [Phytophthora citrophthora]|uniref:Retrovirus-related Pol polyprotein from transposon TNT 1-94 n=2 Tax=Phytophthora citrophthora TaxID=4793 RepID=A0AAD9LAI5_9STRA|nr:Retrovirus-related Pol polyprotein from transposon TNT 1-94 [Phytophthora citrophthora]